MDQFSWDADTKATSYQLAYRAGGSKNDWDDVYSGSDTSFVFNPGDFAASSFGVYTNAVESGGDISGGTAVSGAFHFDGPVSGPNRLTFEPDPGELSVGDAVHVRITDRLNDVCGNPVQTPPIGVQLFKFDVIPKLPGPSKKK